MLVMGVESSCDETGLALYDAEAGMLGHVVNSQHTIQKLVVASSRAIYGEGKYQCHNHGRTYPAHRSESNMESGMFDFRCNICSAKLSAMMTDEKSKIQPISILVDFLELHGY